MLSKNKRNDIEIMAEMLTLAQEEVKKTHLMYKTNISYNQLMYYIGFLVDKGLIDEKDGGQNNIYLITEKGRVFLNDIEKLMNQIK